MTTLSAPQSGSLFVIIAPSGAGKSSLVAALLAQDTHIQLSISYTTRAPRIGEVDGVNYHFTDVANFQAMQANNEFIEWAQVHDNYYGTSKQWIKNALSQGKDVLLEIDYQGAQQVRHTFPEMVGVFILPPSLAVLQQRLEQRGTDSAEVITRRMHNAKTEIAHADECEYVIINAIFADALAQLLSVVQAARLRYAPQKARHSDIFKACGL